METLTEAAAALLRFGAQLLEAGSSAAETRQALARLAGAMRLDALSVEIGFRSMSATARRGGDVVTLVQEIALPGVNSERLQALQSLARRVPDDLPADALDRALQGIAATPRRHPDLAICLAVGLACGAFASLNGSGLVESFVAAVAAAIGQFLRMALTNRRRNPYPVYALCGLGAGFAYVLLFGLFKSLGLTTAPGPAVGLVSATLFLVPGFPMITATLDLLQHEAPVAIPRLAHVIMLLLMAALGLSVVITVAGISLAAASPAPPASWPVLLGARVVASFAGGFGFAVLFNGSYRHALLVGMLAVAGNGLRLALRDAGLSLPLATFLGAVAIGLGASLIRHRVDETRIALTVSAAIVMLPGVYTFQSLVHLNRGAILDGLQSGVLAGFALGAMALGLAAARFAWDR